MIVFSLFQGFLLIKESLMKPQTAFVVVMTVSRQIHLYLIAVRVLSLSLLFVLFNTSLKSTNSRLHT